jgi:hypothetical protein
VVAVLIPALDEEEALPGVLDALPEAVDRVVVVDNGSEDRTVEVARAGGAEVVREARRGYGAACLAGLAHLAADPPEVVVFLDADHTDEPEALPRLVEPVLRGEADLVLGVRRAHHGQTGTLLPHARAGNRLVLGLVGVLFGQRWSDLPPYRAVGWEALRRLEMDDRTWGWTLQMQIRAGVRGLRSREIPLPHRRRVRGRSKISGSLLMSLRVGLRMFATLARERVLAWRGGGGP